MGLDEFFVILAVFVCLIVVTWMAGRIDQWVRKIRRAKLDQFAPRPDGLIATGFLVVVIVGSLVLYSASGAHEPLDSIYRK